MNLGGLSGLSGLSSVYPGQLATQQQQNVVEQQQFQLDDARAAQAGKMALGRTLQALSGGPQAPQAPVPPQMPQQAPMQPPPPGQPSMPLQQPRPAVPPVGPAAGGAARPQPGMPVGAPPGGAQAPGGAPGAPPPGGAQGPLPPGAQFDLKTATAAIARANPGIDGRTLVEALNQALPYLKVEAQQEVIQMRMDMQRQNLEVRRDALDTRREALQQREEQFQEREKRLAGEGEARQKRFDVREARLASQAQVRQDQAYTRLDLQRQDIERKIASGDRTASLQQWRTILDAQHKRAIEVIQAYSLNSGLDDKQRQKLLDEQNKVYTETLNQMRNMRDKSSQPTTQGDLKPGESRVLSEKRVSVAIPDAFKNDPEGTQYKKDGVTWTKRGGQLVPEGQ